MKKTIAASLCTLIVAITLIPGCSSGSSNGSPSPAREVTSVCDYVLDVGTYTSLDWDWAMSNGQMLLEKMSGSCSAAVTQTDDGTTLVGRNFDYYLNNKPLYIFRTAVEDCYETIGISTAPFGEADYNDVIENGLDRETEAAIPFIAIDSLNEEGLYVETNNRLGEWNEDGSVKFSSTGTLQNGTDPLSLQYLPLYLTQNCASVEEAVELVKQTNIYLPSSAHEVNICFSLADALGNYGVLEIADNEVYWLDKQPVQTNFYVNTACYEQSNYKSGLGRYSLLMEEVEGVESFDEMLALMDSVRFSTVNDPDSAPFDVRSEYVGYFEDWTDEYVLDEANKDEVLSQIKSDGDDFCSLSMKELRDYGVFWITVTTCVVNCSEKSMYVKFFEDDSQTLTLGFE